MSISFYVHSRFRISLILFFPVCAPLPRSAPASKFASLLSRRHCCQQRLGFVLWRRMSPHGAGKNRDLIIDLFSLHFRHRHWRDTRQNNNRRNQETLQNIVAAKWRKAPINTHRRHGTFPGQFDSGKWRPFVTYSTPRNRAFLATYPNGRI